MTREYTLTIVSRPGESTGVWRRPPQGSQARNYYLIVEAARAGWPQAEPSRPQRRDRSRRNRLEVRRARAGGNVRDRRPATSATTASSRRTASALSGAACWQSNIRCRSKVASSPNGKAWLMWTGRQTLASIENAIAKLHGEEGQLDQALRSADQRRRSIAKGTQPRAARAGAHQARRDGGRPAGRQSRCRRAPGHADPRRLPLAHRGGHRAARGALEGGGRRRGGARTQRLRPSRPHSERSRRLRAQAEAKVQSTPAWRDSQGHDAMKRTRLPPRRKRRPLHRRPNSVPRKSLMTRTRYSPISGGAGFGTAAYTGGSIASRHRSHGRGFHRLQRMHGPTTRR